ncbi:energy-coupling factor transporter transmembrane protein EcfT [Streptococcus sp. DTU_2020_1001019_1_SI_AUS_MUR_006]|uniref:energy-coupling factor transporter transmembrane component T family protein n=1 Tax=Streptococcus sp. DTU_2020_1001019_1_SI_AUS_MUR_006 TaxID=3077584 RepID=UPI0028E211AA|nr:energy-coupling factor transporter transmembrane protein EcfT [Streptococcus sp. DTU_2020_1001019_1_SI_AUS_MUR_006]WNS72850.1 energy-coupling factor transporter transmembrane protein EcfT [Streptococcus sp. DTU_2020_1001019_1_SI_AUS_MUR_006]
MDNMILGRYIPGNSIIHRLDPRSKLVAMILLIIIAFWANNPITNLILFIATGIFVVLSAVPLSFFIKGLRSMFFLIAFTTLFQLFFISGGQVLFEMGFIKITSYGIEQAGIIFCRFVLIIFFSTLLTLTTMPLSLATAVESLLGPLKRFKVPVHEIGLMLSMSLRFVPTLMDDTIRIMNAQKARGVDFGEGNVIQKVKAMIPILIPLFATSLKRADSLATAMEARGYQGGNGRSQYRQLNWMNRDSIALLFVCVLGAILFLLKS